jgi:hypothetical protein
MESRLKYFDLYDDMKTYYEKELYWQRGVLAKLKRKMNTDSFEGVDQDIGFGLVEMYEDNIKGLKARLKEIELIFNELDDESD